MTNKVKLLVLSLCITGFVASAQETSHFADSICNLLNSEERSRKVNGQEWVVRILSEDRYLVEIKRNGNLVETIEIQNKIRNCFIDGLRVVYYPNQSKRLVTPYSNGSIQGNETWYYPDGKILKISGFDKGTLSGYYIEYYENGYIKENGKYEEGLKKGEWITYYSSYKMRTKGSYFPDYYDVETSNTGDSLVIMNRDRAIINRMSYNEGLDSLMEVLQIIDISDLVFPLRLYAKDGEWVYYDEKGEIVKKEFYKRGELLNLKE